MIKLNEQSDEFKKIEADWYKEVNTLTSKAKLDKFIKKLMTEYQHDFGTSLRALAVVVNATIRYYGKGLTKLQAMFLLFTLMRKTFELDDKVGLQIVQYENIFLPETLSHFKFAIEKGQHETIMDMAKGYLKKYTEADKDVQDHWVKLANGWLPECISICDNKDEEGGEA